MRRLGWANSLVLLCTLVGVVSLASEHAEVQQLSAGERAAPRPLKSNKGAAKYSKWTRGVDSQIKVAEAELAAAHMRSNQAETSMNTLRGKQQAELKQLAAQKAANPNGAHLTKEDINESYGRLIGLERSEINHQRKTIASVRGFLGRLQAAKRKIVKSAMGVLAVEQLEASKLHNSDEIKRRLYNKFKSVSDESFDAWSTQMEKAIMLKQAKQDQMQQSAEAQMASQNAEEATKEISAELDSGASDPNSEHSILSRIRAQSDDSITQQLGAHKVQGGKRVAGFIKSEALAKSKVQKILEYSEEMLKPGPNITKQNAAKQAAADADAIRKAAKQKIKSHTQEKLKGYENAYHAHQMLRGNQTTAAKMAEMSERIHQLRDWEKDHDDQARAKVTSFLKKVEETDHKETELNNLYLKANEMSQKKAALKKLERLNIETSAAKERVSKQGKTLDLPLPRVPAEYKDDGELAQLTDQISKKQSEFASAAHKAASSPGANLASHPRTAPAEKVVADAKTEILGPDNLL